MSHPTTRLLTILELLQTYEHMSGAEIARRLEVAPRTIRRYITSLQDIGIPIETQRGRYGAYRLRRGFKLPPLMLTDEEALAVMLGLLATRKMSFAVSASAVEGALAKIERVLPPLARQRLDAVQQAVTFALTPAYDPPDAEMLFTVTTALRRSRMLSLCYRGWQAEATERVIDPHGIVYLEGRWFMTGFCHLREAIRIFRLDRILPAKIEEATFQSPEHFDALEYIIHSLAMAPSTWYVEVALYLPFAQAQQRIPPLSAALEDKESYVLLRCYAQNLEWIAYVLAGLNCHLVVLRPPELRRVLQQLATHINAIAAAPEIER